MINERWPSRPLGELFEIGAGKTMSAAARDGEGKIPFLRTSNVLWDEIDLSTVDRMAMPAHELESKLLRRGDLLVCEGGEIGRAAVWNGEVEVMAFQNHLHRLRPLADDVEPRYYVYFLQSGFTQLGIFEGAGNKTTIPNLSRNRLASLEVPHPHLDEQRGIVTALARVRDAISMHKRAHDLAQVLKRAAMHRLFTRGLRGEPQKETEIGSTPASWEVSKLGAFFRIKHGFAFDGSLFRSTGHHVLLTPGHFREEGGFRDQADKTRYFDGDFDQQYLLQPGDLLVAMTEQKPGLLGSAVLLPIGHSYLHNQRLGLIVGLDVTRLKRRSLYHLLNFEPIRAEIARTSTGSKVKHTSPDRVRAVTAAIPSLDEQDEIADVLDAIDHKIDLHRRKRAVLEDLFKSLLHKLMTGEIRVTDLDLSVLSPNGSEPTAA